MSKVVVFCKFTRKFQNTPRISALPMLLHWYFYLQQFHLPPSYPFEALFFLLCWYQTPKGVLDYLQYLAVKLHAVLTSNFNYVVNSVVINCKFGHNVIKHDSEATCLHIRQPEYSEKF
jgi:hypothetical protein